ncbi:MAG: hypothetical protein GC199_05155 [Alphaproteobacteria bacterium]|nr:hypothetical protein [Alphaproteobacteria bacterium]
MTLPFVSYRGYVNAWECDEMGHMNVQFFLGKAEEATHALAARLGLRPADPDGALLRARSHHIRFHREMRPSDLVVIRSGVVETAGDRARVLHTLEEGLSGALATTLTLEATIIDRAGDARPLPHDAAISLATDTIPQAAPRAATLSSLPAADLAQADADGLIESIRNVVQPTECDAAGAMTPRAVMGRFSEAQGHFWAHIGIPRHEQAARGLATATTEYAIRYHALPRAGTCLSVRTGLAGLTQRTVRMRHWVFDAMTGAALVSAEGIALLMDKAVRRAVAIPDDVHARMARVLAPSA